MADAANKWAGYSRLYEVEKQKEREKASPANSSRVGIPARVEEIARVENIATLEENTSEPLKPARVEEIARVENFAHPEQYYSTPNELDDKVMPTLKPSEQVVLRRLYRLTRGFHKSTCKVSRGKLASACNISDRTVSDCLSMLEQRGFIKRLSMDGSNANKQDRGYEIEVLLQGPTRAKSSRVENSSTVEKSAHIKKDLKGKDIKGVSPSAEEIKNCPDCNGRGVKYVDPSDYSKGTVKCHHERSY